MIPGLIAAYFALLFSAVLVVLLFRAWRKECEGANDNKTCQTKYESEQDLSCTNANELVIHYHSTGTTCGSLSHSHNIDDQNRWTKGVDLYPPSLPLLCWLVTFLFNLLQTGQNLASGSSGGFILGHKSGRSACH